MGGREKRNLLCFTLVCLLSTPTSSATGSEGGIRLAGSGSTRCSGRVEIFHNGSWGTVYDESWDLNDAHVVCRQLGCGTALSAPCEASFGAGTGPIWLDEVSCSGSESSLSRCRHSGFGRHNYNHNEDAGVVCSGGLPNPSISINPVGGVTWGQDVSFSCSVICGLSGGTFLLKNDSYTTIQSVASNPATFRITRVGFDHEGSYQCQYQKHISNQTFTSPLSSSVRLTVRVILPQPSISMSPSVEVMWGQDVSVTCVISTDVLGGTFILMKTSSSFRKTQTSNYNHATFNIPKVDFDDEGLYHCQYQIRHFISPTSDFKNLFVTVRLPRPNITLTSPDAGLLWTPEGAEVTRGYSFVFTCSINTRHSGGHFSLFMSDSTTTTTKPAVNNSASFNFPVAEYEHQGNYSCVYRVTVSSRSFASADTPTIHVTIKLGLLPLVSSVVSGILLLFLLVLLLVYLVYRRRQRPTQSLSVTPVQMSVRVWNTYKDDEDDDDDEGDYVNVNCVDMKNLKEEEGGVDEDEEDTSDYEQPVSEDEHDYEEAGPSVNDLETKNSTEEEDEDTSDDENDYENVNPQEQIVDIYG